MVREGRVTVIPQVTQFTQDTHHINYREATGTLYACFWLVPPAQMRELAARHSQSQLTPILPYLLTTSYITDTRETLNLWMLVRHTRAANPTHPIWVKLGQQTRITDRNPGQQNTDNWFSPHVLHWEAFSDMVYGIRHHLLENSQRVRAISQFPLQLVEYVIRQQIPIYTATAKQNYRSEPDTLHIESYRGGGLLKNHDVYGALFNRHRELLNQMCLFTTSVPALGLWADVSARIEAAPRIQRQSSLRSIASSLRSLSGFWSQA